MTDLRNLWLSIYLGPAIVYVKRYLWEELTIIHNLKDIRPDLYHILYVGGLVFEGRTTEIGNTIFSCTSLVEYNVLTSTDLMIERLGAYYPNENYYKLRKGLGEQVIAQSIDYMEFMRGTIPINPEIILDICGGDGTYLHLLGEMFQAERCFLMDKDASSAAINQDLSNKDRYHVSQWHDVRSYIIPGIQKADLVLLNEVLHLKKKGEWWIECIGTALRNSQKDAHICIGELLSDVTFDWRMKAMTSDGEHFNIDTFQDFLANHYSKIFNHNFNYIETDTHWFCVLRRIK